MPDSAPPADGAALTSSWLQTMVREQVIRTVTSSTRPTGVEGCVIYETDTDRYYGYSGSAWVYLGALSATGRAGVVLTDAAQSFTSGATADITWGTEVSDVDGWTSGGSATLTVPSGWGGQYQISFVGIWASNPTTAYGWMLLNAAIVGVGSALVVSGDYALRYNTTRVLAAGDTLKFVGLQSSGGAVNLVSRLEIARLGS